MLESSHGQLALAFRRRQLEVDFILWRRQNHLNFVDLILTISVDVILDFLLKIVQFLDDLRPAQASLQHPCLTCKQANKHPLT